MPLISELVTKLTADASVFKRELKDAEFAVDQFGVKGSSSITKVGLAITALGIGGLTAFGYLMSKIATNVGDAADNADKLGISLAHFQELAYAANNAGVSTEGLQSALSKMNQTLGLAAQGSEKEANAFSAIGLSISDLLALSPDERYLKIAAAVRQVKNDTQQATEATTIFGKQGRDGLGLINSNIEESIKKYRELGITLSDSQTKALDSFDETKKLLDDVFISGFKKAAANLAPFFENFLNYLIRVIKEWGGLDKVAKSFADTVKEGFTGLIDTLDGVYARMVKIQIFDKETALARAEINNPVQGGQYLSLQQTKDVGIGGSRAGGQTDHSFSFIPSVKNLQATGGLTEQITTLYQKLNHIENQPGTLKKVLNENNSELEKSTKSVKDFGDAVVQVKDDLFTAALKNNSGTGDQINRIIKQSGQQAPEINTEFDRIAGETLQAIQQGSDKKGFVNDNLALLESAAELSGVRGENNTAMLDAIKELEKFVDKNAHKDVRETLQVIITPSEGFTAKWLLTKESDTFFKNLINKKAADEARGVAR